MERYRVDSHGIRAELQAGDHVPTRAFFELSAESLSKSAGETLATVEVVNEQGHIARFQLRVWFDEMTQKPWAELHAYGATQPGDRIKALPGRYCKDFLSTWEERAPQEQEQIGGAA